MKRQPQKSLDALIFIDTNIFLDFYRIRKSNVSMKYLEEIERHTDLIITSSQVEMEFKKNRQAVILESIDEVQKIKISSVNIPVILSDTLDSKMLERYKKDFEKKTKQLKSKIEKILFEPGKHDIVYKSLEKLFRNKSTTNLNRDNKLRFTIRNLAKKRFVLGYPPRKNADISIGDAINWEWIIRCAETTRKDIIIVTRDTDFGCVHNGSMYLNDWLRQEFKERISPRRKIILTDKLTTAFKEVNIAVTEEMISEEEDVIERSTFNFELANWQKAFDGMQHLHLNNPKLLEAVKSFEKIKDNWSKILNFPPPSDMTDKD